MLYLVLPIAEVGRCQPQKYSSLFRQLRIFYLKQQPTRFLQNVAKITSIKPIDRKRACNTCNLKAVMKGFAANITLSVLNSERLQVPTFNLLPIIWTSQHLLFTQNFHNP